MPAKDIAVGGPNFFLGGKIFCLAGDEPSQAGDILHVTARGFNNLTNIAEGLAHLVDEII